MGETRVDLQHLLEDLRDAYTGALEETILTEVVANALDSGRRPCPAHANDAAAVALMLELGLRSARSRRRRLGALLPHNPPIGVPDPTYEGTPLEQCLYGSRHGWTRDTGDFTTTVRLLLDAGERPDPTIMPIGRDDVDAVLREPFARLRHRIS